MIRFWKWLTLFGWKRWRSLATKNDAHVMGVPGNRDSLVPYIYYTPKPVDLGDGWGFDCRGDGHYMQRMPALRRGVVEEKLG